MRKKQFKTESKKLMDMMINSIYTHKEIFLRELISNASDAIDKRHFKSLTDSTLGLDYDKYEITLDVDKDKKTITITDNGCGMTEEELESNLGTIAKSGSYDFKANTDAEEDDDIDIIGQFGVGFYSAFMVCGNVVVKTRSIESDTAYRWESSGVDGYTVEPCEKSEAGTVITMTLKDDTDEENYSIYLEEFKIRELVSKYSDYIRYPIKMEVTKSRPVEKDGDGEAPRYESYKEVEILNSMVPLWKKEPSEVAEEEYNDFYRNKFMDYENPIKVIRQKAEGVSEYTALLFVPSHAPFNYYSQDYEKGLQLYSRGVLIMDKCKELLPDYFGFVHGLVDSSDLSLNISRETLQQDAQVRRIAKALEKKISGELLKLQTGDREKYEKFYDAFGTQLKWGVYSDYGMHKDSLQDLIMFRSSKESKYVTLKEYTERMAEGQEKIYYASGENADRISDLPQVEAVVDRGYEVLYLTEDVDEFALQVLRTYNEKEFVNVCKEDVDVSTDEEKEKLKNANEKSKEMFDFMKESIGGVNKVCYTNTIRKHAVCLSSEGELSIGMEKVLNKMPAGGGVKAGLVLNINLDHPIAQKLTALYDSDKDKLASYSKILFAQAQLINGVAIENPGEISDLVCELML